MLATLTLYVLTLISHTCCLNFSFSTRIEDEVLENFIRQHLQYSITIIDNQNGDNLYNMNVSKTIYNLDKKIQNRFTSNSNYVIFITEKGNLTSIIEKLIATEIFSNHYKYLVVLDKASIDEISEAFLLMWEYNIYNAVTYVNKTFYTWFPYDKKNSCGNKANVERVAAIVDPFKGKIPWKVDGCSLNVSWVPVPPYMINPFEVRAGILIDIVNIIGQKLHLNVEYIKNNTDYMEDTQRTNNYDSLTDDMARRGIGAAPILVLTQVCKISPMRDVELSDILLQYDIYFALPPRKRKYSKIYLVNMFATFLLTCIVIVYLVVCLVLRILTEKPLVTVLMEVIRLSLQQSIQDVPPSSTPRALLACYLLYNICIYTAWQTELSSMLTNPHFEGRIETFRQLLDSELKIIGFKFVQCSVANEGYLAEDFKKKIIQPSGGYSYLDSISEFIGNPLYVIAMDAHMLFKFKNRDEMEVIIREKVNTSRWLLFVQKGFPLLERVNYWIGRVKESGIVEKLVKDSLKKEYVMRNDLRVDREPIGLGQLSGAFLILLGGLGGSCVAFYLECLIY